MLIPHRSLLAFAFIISLNSLHAQEPKVPPEHAANMVASAQLFKDKLRGFVTENCLECHGGAKTKSGFNLASRELLLKGGDRGPAILLNKGKTSPLVKYVAREEEPHMPPKKPVSKEIVAALAKWIDLGAAYDKPLIENAAPVTKKPMVVTDKDKQYWAYRPLHAPQVPEVQAKAWPRNSIDNFILAKLEAKKLTPASDADKRTLIRRVFFDVTGLPPTPEQVQAFVNDKAENAYEKVVDELLKSDAFGERWARHWLDPARYGESHGFEHDYFRPNAYHYRDFVTKAINQDMPYDQFLKWQLAGDEFAPGDPMALAATGFLGAGVYPTQITNREAERIRYDAMDDMLATTGHAMLALTVGCARCHDHKYDPIPTRDYYRLLSAFTSTVRAEIEVDMSTPEQKQAQADFLKKLEPVQKTHQEYETKQLPAKLNEWIATKKAKKEALPKIANANAAKGMQAIFDGKTTLEKLPKVQHDAVIAWFGPQVPEWKASKAQVAELEKQRPKLNIAKIQATTEGAKPMRHHTADGSIPDFYPKTYELKRGDPDQKADVVELGFLQVLSRHAEQEKHWIVAKPPEAKSSFRRTSLANWIVDTDTGAGALAARVMVNRLWHHHMGRGIVSTLNDFGFQGSTPTHPELLEWLANDLVKNGWKLKRMHKQILMSRVYQLSATTNAATEKADPENLLWHAIPRQRLEAEAIRDNLLAVGGLLDRTMYGPGTLNQNMKRRSIYFSVQRSQLIPFLQVFDWPDSLTSASARPNTVVAPQALLFLNNPLVRECAKGFAARFKPIAEKSLPDGVAAAYEIAFNRKPTKAETDAGIAYIQEKSAGGKLDRAVEDYALVLMSLNEFIFVD